MTASDRRADQAAALRVLRDAPHGLSAQEVGLKLGYVHNAKRRAEIGRALDRLARLGRVTREVRKEFDRQTSARSSWYFGGTGSMVRYRAYYKVWEVSGDTHAST